MDDKGVITGSLADLPHGGVYTVTATDETGSTTAVFLTLVLDAFDKYTPATGDIAIGARAELEAMVEPLVT